MIDTNHDGISQADELFSLSELGIVNIGIGNAAEGLEDGNGNLVTGKAAVSMADGSKRDVAEMDLDVNWSNTLQANKIEVDYDLVAGLPNVLLEGETLSLHQAMTVDEVLRGYVTEYVNCPVSTG